jgi:DNA-directed RNA polymerase specialized sigma24 family protein
MTGAKKQAFAWPLTNWSELRASVLSEAARNQIVSRYSAPVVAYLTFVTRDAALAEELAQKFILRELGYLDQRNGRGVIQKADPRRGKFRQLLMRSLKNYATDHYRDERREGKRATRDGNANLDQLPDGKGATPEQAFMASWVGQLISQAVDALKEWCDANGQRTHYAVFVGHFLPEPRADTSWEALARQFGLKDGKQARTRAETVVPHFRKIFLELLRSELGTGHDVRREIVELLTIFEE